VSRALETLATKDDLAHLRREIGEAKAKMIRWMFVFWLAQVEVTFLIFLYFVKG
jgi:hypothetical protein